MRDNRGHFIRRMVWLTAVAALVGGARAGVAELAIGTTEPPIAPIEPDGCRDTRQTRIETPFFERRQV